MVKTVFFDLDGTLLPMDEKRFLDAYLGGIARKMAPHGYDPDLLIKSLWKGTGAMIQNDGSCCNEEIFWEVFSASCGRDARQDEPLFEEFYRNEFQDIRHVCGFEAKAKEVIFLLKQKGIQLVLATNPLFPALATHSRVRWAGLDPADFTLITTYENSSRCKPNPDYYREILDKLDVNPEECLMVGNDAQEDMIAATLGMQVFLLTDCLLNKKELDISHYPQGGYPELISLIRSL